MFAAMEEPSSLRQLKRLRCRIVALLQFLILLQLAPPFANGDTDIECYDPWELDALQGLRQAWEGTPDMEVNLPGWSSVVQTPCNNFFNAQANESNWQGVQCAYIVTYSEQDYLRIVELIIRDSNIVGTLSEKILNLSSLCNLEISGNRNLTGELPYTLGDSFISTLDLHGNGFHGNVTLPLYAVFNLKTIDLSDNYFTGPFPHNSTNDMASLGLLNLAKNKFDGQVPYEAFERKPVLQRLDLSRNNFSGSMELNFTGVKALRYLNISSNMFNGSLPNLTAIPTLRHVNFSHNSFEGTNINLASIFNSECLNKSLSILDISHTSVQVDLYTDLGNLQEIYLDNSTISGTLDISRMVQHILSTKTNTRRLQILSLRDNNIEHVIYDQSAITEVSTQLRLQGNPYCNTTNGNDGTRCFCSQTCLNTEEFVEGRRANKRVIIATTSASGGIVLLLFIAVVILHHRSKRYKEYLLAQFEEKFQQFDIKPTIFSYNDIRLATKDFHADLRLGAGAYGAVYKGEFLKKNDKNVFAVKRLLIFPSQGIDSFLNEVVLITGMRHRNLVALKGCCLRDKERLLVYEYIDNGDVEQLFFGERRAFVDWQTRFKICIGVANGLHYLHDLANPRIIHRDIKAANILLDANFEAKIADFGLALLFPDGTNHIETVTIAGTRGYLAPEYASRGQLSDKADVYSFGILCLEIVSGRRNIVPTSSADQIYLLEWARQLQRDKNAMALLDGTVDQLSDVELDEVRRLIHVALQCTHSEAAPRPTMANVVAMLLGQSVSETMSLAMSVFNSSILEEDSESSGFSQTQSEFVALNSSTKLSSSSYSLRIRNSIP